MPLRAAEHWSRVITAALARVQRMLTVSQQLHVCYQAEKRLMEIPKRAPQRLTTHEVWRHSHPGLCLAAGVGWKAHVCSDKGSTKLPFWDLSLGNRTHDPPQFFPSKIIPTRYLYQENHFCYAVLPIPSIWGNTPTQPLL